MTAPRSDAGAALALATDGALLEVLVDGFGLPPSADGRFEGLVEPADRAKARRFLAELRERRVVSGWAINVRFARSVETLYFAGSVVGEQLMVVIAAQPDGTPNVLDGVIGINNAQTNALRTALKDMATIAALRERRELDEFSKLNNELANLQRELAHKNAELEARNEEKSQILAIASHDLRSPIAAVLGFAELLAKQLEGQLTERQRQQVDRMRHNCQLVLRLVDDLLAVARDESQSFPHAPALIDVAPVVRRVAENAEAVAAAKQIAVRLAIEGPLPAIEADAERLEQALTNLISNAIKFSSPGSVIGLAARCRDGAVLLSVRDQGPGLGPDERARIFRPFVRGAARPTGGEPTTGLGLAIVQRIADAHGGRVWVESEPGKGAEFVLALPVK